MISFKMFAGTDVGLRENNEDNFTVCPDLIPNKWIVPADCQQAFPLGEKGCVMVVADGMGGQNAGEVASAIAIETVQELFSAAHLPAGTWTNPDAVKAFLKKVISEADIRVKRHSEKHANDAGMGSTIVMAWIVRNTAYIAWLGDSRAYSYVPGKGIIRISKDHSYVQQLVDAGTLTDEEAMTHPNSNIITRSLGDASQKAKAEVVAHPLENGEMILLCSDGLSGVCKDSEIGAVIEKYMDSLQLCKEKLTTAALAAGGSDNITIALLRFFDDSAPVDIDKKSAGVTTKWKQLTTSLRIVMLLAALAILGGLGYIGYLLQPTQPVKQPTVEFSLDGDSIKAGEKLKYHLMVNGTDSVCKFHYDENLIALNEADSAIRIAENARYYCDTIINIHVECNGVRDSVHLLLISASKPTLIREKPKEIPADTVKNKVEEHKKDTIDAKAVITPSPAGGAGSPTVTNSNNQ